jgi:hypothetical protein
MGRRKRPADSGDHNRVTLPPMTSSKRRRRLAGWALGGLVVAALGAAIVAYGYYTLDWGCPSQAELQRPLASQDVTDAFGQGELKLDPTRFPVALPPGVRAYRHASGERHSFRRDLRRRALRRGRS